LNPNCFDTAEIASRWLINRLKVPTVPKLVAGVDPVDDVTDGVDAADIAPDAAAVGSPVRGLVSAVERYRRLRYRLAREGPECISLD
jgi:hypothetical protein